MTVEERRRIELFERLVPVLGEEAATTMLELLPPAGQDAATKDDLERLWHRIDAKFDGLDAKFDGIDAMFDAIDAKFDAVAARFGTVDDKLTQFATKADLQREIRMAFVAQTVALAGLLGAAAAFFG